MASGRTLLIAVAFCCCTLTARAQTCVGDCDSSGRPTIDELVRGVNILLERAELSLCPMLDTSGDGQVAVNELVRAVADILYGCGVAPPTPEPTSTPTVTRTPTSSPPERSVTPTFTALATATPTSPQNTPSVAGQWREDQYDLASSTCISEINDLIEALVVDLPACVYAVTQAGASVTLTDCDEFGATGQVDQSGLVTVDLPVTEQVTQDGCTLVFDAAFSADLATSPTTAEQTLDVTFEDACEGLPACRIVVSSRWTRL